MPTNEEGEFELVLGNKQLLSVFFIVVVLLGVFFTMGYIVGRNTLPGGSQMAAAKDAQPFEPPTSSTEDDPDRPSPAGPAPTALPPADEPPKPTASSSAEPEPPKPAQVEPPKPAAPKPEPLKADPPKPPSAGAGGLYLQVAATRKSEADLLAEVLTKKGYPTVVAPVPETALFRVMVGPMREADVPKAREALTAAGFKPFPRKL
jgi:hypothetical protein